MTDVGARDAHWRLSAPVTSGAPPGAKNYPWTTLPLTGLRHIVLSMTLCFILSGVA